MNVQDRDRLRRLLASFDEAGLVALANKGLVRRAQKDLEAGGLGHEETEAAVVVRGPDWVVTMPPDGPAHATDDTRASGVTRQILAATIYLRDCWAGAPPAEVSTAGVDPQPPAAVPQPSADDAALLQEALFALVPEDLEKWAGKNTLREALALVQAGLEVEVESHAGLTLRLVRQELEVRLLPAGRKQSARALLDGALTTAPRASHRRWVVAAVLAFRQGHGQPLAVTAEAAPADDSGAPRSRLEVVAAAKELLEGMTATGLAHPSERMVERLCTLSVSAVAVHLPRLSRLLRALADEVGQVLGREAAADTGRLFDHVCLTYALAQALTAAGPQPPVALAGRHRTQYDPVGDLRLTGVGAYPWRTASGFEGLTVLLWDEVAARFLTWTASRPVGAAGRFSLAQTYGAEAVWPGSGAPERFSRSAFTLHQARANPLGRLSGSQNTVAADLAPADPGRLDFGGRAFSDWRALHQYALRQYPIGLTEKNTLDRIVVLRPAQWKERVFDELRQQFRWRLQDDAGNAVALTLPWAGVNEDSIEFLEAVHPARDELAAVVVRLAFDGTGVSLEPLSLLSRGGPNGHRVLNPAFDRGLILSRQSNLLEKLRQKYGRDRIPTVLTADHEGDEEVLEAGAVDGGPPGVQTRLAEVERVLLQIAEAGTGRLDESLRQRFRRLSLELKRAGLREMGGGLDALGRPEGSASAVLWNGYLCRLHRESIRLTLSGMAD